MCKKRLTLCDSLEQPHVSQPRPRLNSTYLLILAWITLRLECNLNKCICIRPALTMLLSPWKMGYSMSIIFISTGGALRRPLTYDDHNISSHLSIHKASQMFKQASDWSQSTSNELGRAKAERQKDEKRQRNKMTKRQKENKMEWQEEDKKTLGQKKTER